MPDEIHPLDKLRCSGPVERRPRLVSLGRQYQRQPGHGGQKAKVYEFEGLVDIRNPSERWIRWRGDPYPTRLSGNTTPPEKPEPLGAIPRRLAPTGDYPPGRPDEVVALPDPTAQDRAVADAMFARIDNRVDPAPYPAVDEVGF